MHELKFNITSNFSSSEETKNPITRLNVAENVLYAFRCFDVRNLTKITFHGVQLKENLTKITFLAIQIKEN